MPGNSINAEGATLVANVLKMNTRLATLNLDCFLETIPPDPSDNELGPAGASAIATGLKFNSSLTNFNLEGCLALLLYKLI
jgi:hypothetical protein